MTRFTRLVLSKVVCRFELNKAMMARRPFETLGHPENMRPGGKHWPLARRTMEEESAAIRTPASARAFCDRMKLEMRPFYQS